MQQRETPLGGASEGNVFALVFDRPDVMVGQAQGNGKERVGHTGWDSVRHILSPQHPLFVHRRSGDPTTRPLR